MQMCAGADRVIPILLFGYNLTRLLKVLKLPLKQDKTRNRTSANLKFPIWPFSHCFKLIVTIAVVIGKGEMPDNNALLHFVTTEMTIAGGHMVNQYGLCTPNACYR